VKINFIGTDKIGISINLRCGHTSLKKLREDYPSVIKDYDTVDKKQNIVVVIRDVIDKWKSGYQREFYQMLRYRSNYVVENIIVQDDRYKESNFPVEEFLILLNTGYYIKHSFTEDTYINMIGLNIIAGLHNYHGNLKWMITKHAKFWSWIRSISSPVNQKTLFELSYIPNIWFVELKDLSNPKFLEWLQEKDESWKVVKEILNIRPGGEVKDTSKNFWNSMDIFFSEYKKGKIFQDKKLVCPFYNLQANKSKLELEVMEELRNKEQKMVDCIRVNHERYLRF